MKRRLWHISGWDVGPHWDHAVVWARDEEAAKAVLLAAINDREDDPDWDDRPGPSEWRVTEHSGHPDDGVVFYLSGECR